MLFEDSKRIIDIVQERLEFSFKDFPEEYKPIISRYCIILIFLDREEAIMKLLDSSETSDDLIKNLSRFVKLTLDELDYRIRIVKEKELKSLDEQRLTLLIDNIERFFKEHSELL